MGRKNTVSESDQNLSWKACRQISLENAYSCSHELKIENPDYASLNVPGSLALAVIFWDSI